MLLELTCSAKKNHKHAHRKQVLQLNFVLKCGTDSLHDHCLKKGRCVISVPQGPTKGYAKNFLNTHVALVRQINNPALNPMVESMLLCQAGLHA